MSDGVIYLLHFSKPFHHERHYLGFCSSYHGLDSRFAYHAAGRGSKLLGAVSRAGVKFELVRLWRGTRDDERRLKKRKNTPRLCPCCSAKPETPIGLPELMT